MESDFVTFFRGHRSGGGAMDGVSASSCEIRVVGNGGLGNGGLGNKLFIGGIKTFVWEAISSDK